MKIGLFAWVSTVLVGLMMMPGPAFAGGTVPTKIVALENGWYGEGLAITATTSTSVPGCTPSSSEYGVDASHPNFDAIVAMALAAFASGANVILITADNGCAFAGRTKILAIKLIR